MATATEAHLGIAGVRVEDITSLTGSLTEDFTGGFVNTAYKKIEETGGWSLQSTSSRSYFLRVKYNKFNHTTNDTNTRSATQPIVASTSYPTTVGLFDANKNLVATAKLSKPLKKTPSEEYLLTVRISH